MLDGEGCWELAWESGEGVLQETLLRRPCRRELTCRTGLLERISRVPMSDPLGGEGTATRTHTRTPLEMEIKAG